jgi:pyruvate,orthophosphate dikinase
MMDTVLNLGMNEKVAESLIRLTENPRFVYDSYRRFIQMFSDVVMELPKAEFEEILDQMKSQRKVQYDADLSADDMKELVGQFKAFYREKMGNVFPEDPKEQLMAAIQAVFRSWNNPRAISYLE